jgi:hypothetical protein
MAKKAVSNLINDYHLLSYDLLDSTNEEAKRLAGGASMLCGHNVGPVGGAKRDIVYFHKSLNFPRFAPIVKGYPLFWRVTHSHTHGI